MGMADLFKNGIIKENPIFVQAIGMCPTLAVTTSATNGLGMGIATTAVLTCSNLVISLMRKSIPAMVRIPSFIVVIASFVTVVQFILEGYVPALHNALGIFIPLIVVNCLILARAESFASKTGPLRALLDGFAMGLGFTFALVIIGAARELLGDGSIFGVTLLPGFVPRTLIMLLPPGAFISLGLIMAFLAWKKNRSERGAN